MTSIELQDLSKKDTATTQADDGPARTNEGASEENIWAWVAATWCSILAVVLFVFPRFLLFLATSSDVENHRDVLTPLESFLATQFSILLFAVATSLISSMPSSDPVSPRGGSVGSSHPLLLPITMSSLLSAFIAWNTSETGALSLLVATGSGTVGLWGVWNVAFAGPKYISRKTGADKRTSAFLFGNRSAASAQKREWKRQQGL